MRARFLFLLVSIGAIAPGVPALRAQIVTYTFGPSGSPTTAATTVATNLSASVFTGSTGSPATGSGTPLFTAGSGSNYFTATTWTGGAPGSNYFEFTLTPANGYDFQVTTISFGYRSTGTGPTAFAIRSSADAYGADLTSGTLTNDGSWYASGPSSITLSGLSSATTFRLYASGASAGGGTLRVDDVTLAGSISAVPEPSTYAAIFGAVVLAGAAWRRRRERTHG